MAREYRNSDEHLLDRLLEENAELTKQNKALQQSVTRLELFNKVVERENAELRERLSAPKADEVQEEGTTTMGRWMLTLVIAGLLVAGSYILYNVTRPQKTTHATATPTSKRDTVYVASVPPGEPETVKVNPKDKPRVEEKPALDPPAGVRPVSVTSEQTPASRYKVRSRAYFHNEPDRDTRRAAYITHWNNAVLTPQKQTGEFVYIVFKNHLGQTSRGWLRKDELIPIP